MVKKPMAAPDLPKHMVTASSYAALNPSNELWREYLTEINRRRAKHEISEDEYHVLRSSREARQALMDVTLGDASATGSVGTRRKIIDEIVVLKTVESQQLRSTPISAQK